MLKWFFFSDWLSASWYSETPDTSDSYFAGAHFFRWLRVADNWFFRFSNSRLYLEKCNDCCCWNEWLCITRFSDVFFPNYAVFVFYAANDNRFTNDKGRPKNRVMPVTSPDRFVIIRDSRESDNLNFNNNKTKHFCNNTETIIYLQTWSRRSRKSKFRPDSRLCFLKMLCIDVASRLLSLIVSEIHYTRKLYLHKENRDLNLWLVWIWCEDFWFLNAAWKVGIDQRFQLLSPTQFSPPQCVQKSEPKF